MEHAVITDPDYYKTLKMLSDIASTHKLLSKAEERAMIDKYRNDRATLNKLLIMHNVQLVISIAKNYVKRSKKPADVLADGYLGLTIAAEKFDIDRDIKFNTFATSWVFKYAISSFYSRSPETGVNAFSLNQHISNSENDIDTIISSNSFASDYESASSENVEDHVMHESLRKIINDVIKFLENSNKLTDFGKAIIKRNFIDGESLAKISSDYNVKYTVAAAEKRKIAESIRQILGSRYNITKVADAI